MINTPLVSVGIPTYNRPEKLEKVLEYISNQTYKNLEIIVSDNCSPTDETNQIVKQYILKDSRIKFFRQEANKGMSFNFSFVLNEANGEYFMWAQDDDQFDPKFIESIMSKLLQNPYASLGFCSYDYIKNTEIIHNPKNLDYSGNVWQRLYKIFKNNDETPEYGIFKAHYLKNGQLENTQTLWKHNAYNFWRLGFPPLFGLLSAGEYAYIDEKLYFKRIYDADAWFNDDKDPYKHDVWFIRWIKTTSYFIDICLLECKAIFIMRPKLSSLLLFIFPILLEIKAFIQFIKLRLLMNVTDEHKKFIKKILRKN